MRVLIACEESQEVCKAFRAKGHETYSCDILPCSGGKPEWHLQMDVFQALELREWDLVIMHPPCTALCVTGNRVYAFGKPLYHNRIGAVKWTQRLWDKATSICRRVAMENPVGVLNSMGKFPKPQYIQPYEHGHVDSKKTGLWLYNLPPIVSTKIVEPEWVISKSGKRHSKAHWYSSGNSKLRSKTYPGIAAAFASQWG